MSVPGLYDGPPMNHFSRGRSFDDADPYFGNNKQTGKARNFPESNVQKSIAADNVKAGNVAKIKVVVCTFCSVQFVTQIFSLASFIMYCLKEIIKYQIQSFKNICS